MIHKSSFPGIAALPLSLSWGHILLRHPAFPFLQRPFLGSITPASECFSTANEVVFSATFPGEGVELSLFHHRETQDKEGFRSLVLFNFIHTVLTN